MRAVDIQPGMVLKLKKERQEAYGMDTPFVKVDALRADRHGYKRMWVVSGMGIYRATDFAKFECWAKLE